jgi:hypothetical protein
VQLRLPEGTKHFDRRVYEQINIPASTRSDIPDMGPLVYVKDLDDVSVL